jgi:hypothetical protein
LDTEIEDGVFELNDAENVPAKDADRKEGESQPLTGTFIHGAPPLAPAPDAMPEVDAPHTPYANPSLVEPPLPEPFLPEEEPELIGTPKAPKIHLNHDAPLHANSQSLFKSLRGWLFGDDSDEDAKLSGHNAFSSNKLRNADAVLAHAMRAEGWRDHPVHYTGAAYTGNLDHTDKNDMCVDLGFAPLCAYEVMMFEGTS